MSAIAVFLFRDRTCANVTDMELQRRLLQFPECVLVPGSFQQLRQRFGELGITQYRGSGFGWTRRQDIFKENICIDDVSLGADGSMPCVRLGRGSSFGFQTEISNDEIAIELGLKDRREQSNDFQTHPNTKEPLISAKFLHESVRKCLASLLEHGVQGSKFELMVDNDGMPPDRATKFVFGTVADVLSSKFNGMHMTEQHGVPMVIIEWESFTIRCQADLFNLNNSGHIFYCGRWSAEENMPGGDGQCGPKNGPQCSDCRKRQNRIPYDSKTTKISIDALGDNRTRLRVKQL
jgi:hypothetical protein